MVCTDTEAVCASTGTTAQYTSVLLATQVRMVQVAVAPSQMKSSGVQLIAARVSSSIPFDVAVTVDESTCTSTPSPAVEVVQFFVSSIFVYFSTLLKKQNLNY